MNTHAHRSSATSWAALLLGGLSACGWGPVPLDQFCAKSREAYCRRAVRCGQASDKVDCETVIRTSTWFYSDLREACRPHADAVDAGLIRYDAQKAAKCLESIAESSACEVPVTSAIACDEAFVGLLAVGAPCPGTGCARGSTCAWSYTSCGACIADTPVGGVVLNAPCAAGSFPVNDGGVVICAPPLSEGEACSSTECEPWCLPCAENLFCTSTLASPEVRCRKTTVANLGEPCGPFVAAACAPRLGCQASTSVLEGTCVRLGDVGDACGMCFGGLVCAGGRCEARAFPTAGSSCGPTQRCPWAFACVDGTCVESTARSVGAPCNIPGSPGDCDAPLSCAHAGLAYGGPVCQALPLAGETCELRRYGTVCGQGLLCLNAGDAGVCTPLAEACR